ncbi:MAG: DUF1684 domain-containing protein [Terrimonas sp.]|nr:DUF1684 domain-containing protein [Terrimonas sp.]
MKGFLLTIFSFLFVIPGFSQGNREYRDSVQSYIRNYIRNHEVVTGKDKQYLHFFPVDEQYRVLCHFEKKENSPWFRMETSGLIRKNYRVYGTLSFYIHDTLVSLQVYQSQSLMQDPVYREYLFLPFTDATTGIDSYSGGRYYDFTMNEIQNNRVTIDFNKAYNPYCAYISGKYNCPIPPKENNLPVAIRAGEMAYGKSH